MATKAKDKVEDEVMVEESPAEEPKPKSKGFFLSDPDLHVVDVNGQNFHLAPGTYIHDLPEQHQRVYAESHQNKHPECDISKWPGTCEWCKREKLL